MVVHWLTPPPEDVPAQIVEFPVDTSIWPLTPLPALSINAPVGKVPNVLLSIDSVIAGIVPALTDTGKLPLTVCTGAYVRLTTGAVPAVTLTAPLPVTPDTGVYAKLTTGAVPAETNTGAVPVTPVTAVALAIVLILP